MNFYYYLSLFPILAISSCASTPPGGTTINKIAFGSCSHEYDEQQMWSEIITEEVDLLILCGDNIYGDTDDMNLLKAKYDHQKSGADYQKLIKQTPVIGIWDDHDYGVNDGGKYFVKKEESKHLMLDFFDVPENDAVRSREGAYNSYIYGTGNNKVKVLLMDVRYFRDTLMADTLTSARYIINKTGDILGEQQWRWLEEELANSDAAIHILVSGIQVIAEDHIFEKWENFPTARQRLFDLLSKVKPKGTFIISGDRHIAEISKITVPGLPYPLYDFTASGLTHTWSEEWPEKNQHRVEENIIRRNYGLIFIDWSKRYPQITFEVKGHGDSTFMKHSFDFNIKP